MSIFKKIKDQLFQGLFGQAIVLIAGVVILLSAVYAITWMQSGATSNRLSARESNSHVDTLQTEQGVPTFWFVDEDRPSRVQIHSTLAGDERIHRLLQQVTRVRIVRFEHYNYFRFFYRMRYSISFVQALVSLLAVVVGLMITKEGWGSAKPLMLIAFFVFSTTAGLLQLLPETLHLSENISSNTEKFVEYQELEDEALTYLGTHLTQDEDSLDIGSFIVYMDHRISNIHHVALKLGDFPAQKIQEKLGEIDERLKEREEKDDQ